MLTALVTILGALAPVAPEILGFLNRREDNRLAEVEMNHEKDMIQMQAQFNEQEAKNAVDLVNAEADRDEGQSLRDHDASFSGGWFINSLRASVRPIITYCFFGLFVYIKFVALRIMMTADGVVEQTITWNEIYTTLWDDNTAAIFGAVIGFWFGSRAIEKYKKMGRSSRV